MDKKILAVTVLFLAVSVSAVIILAKNNNNRADLANVGNNASQEKAGREPIILFYGDGCPHCAKVEEYLSKNNIKDKISFEEKEVYYNQSNAKELAEKAKICGLATNSIGVPFLWDGEKCYIGDKDVIKFFKQAGKQAKNQ
jgi:glutaredoxin